MKEVKMQKLKNKAKTFNTTEFMIKNNMWGGVTKDPNQDYLNEGTSKKYNFI